jgi:carbon monoxide dehydrogenase subunit G
MKLQYSGEEKIPVRPATVWAFVSDPEKVGRCLPEVIDVTVKDPTHVDVVVQVAVGPVRGKFKLQMELKPDPARQRIELNVSGGGFGSAVDMTAGADAVDAGDGTTILKWTGEAEVRGPVAAVGSRVLDAQAHKLISQAFANIRQALSSLNRNGTRDAHDQPA